jgi:hypothetical protein
MFCSPGLQVQAIASDKPTHLSTGCTRLDLHDDELWVLIVDENDKSGDTREKGRARPMSRHWVPPGQASTFIGEMKLHQRAEFSLADGKHHTRESILLINFHNSLLLARSSRSFWRDRQTILDIGVLVTRLQLS